MPKFSGDAVKYCSITAGPGMSENGACAATDCLKSRGVAAVLAALFSVAILAGEAGHAAIRHGTWISQTDRPGGDLPCYVAASPIAREPKGLRRDPAYAYVTVLPRDGIAGEVSFKFGFPLRHGTEVVAIIGAARFRLFALGERAFVADRPEEERLLESMRRGTRLVVIATSDRGNVTRDTYALSGLAEALSSLAAADCS
jgi:hypothetical protein